MAETNEPDVSALVAAQERLAQLDVEEAEIFIKILEDVAAKCDEIIDRYSGLDIRPPAINQVINHRENLRGLHMHMCRIAGRAVKGPDVAYLALPPIS